MWKFLKSIIYYSERKRAKLLANWGEEKSPRRPLAYPKLLFDYRPSPDSLDEQTADDIDLDGLFRFVDRTVSGPGAQLLYRRLRSGDAGADGRQRLENLIGHISEKERDQLVLYLHDLAENKDYLFPYLLYAELPHPSPYIRYIRWLQWVSFAALLFGLLYPVLYVLFIPILAVNLFIHYRHKQDVGQFVAVAARIKQLRQTGAKLLQKAVLSAADKQAHQAALKQIDKLLQRTKILNVDRIKGTELGSAGWAVAEVFKFATLIDVTIFAGLLQQIDRYRAALEKIFLLVGEVDVALSVIALRQRLPHYCYPDLNGTTTLSVTRLYHPLLPGAVVNDLSLPSGSLLITGSNMSGKSTFIKTLNLNAIFAQTLNTAFAAAYTSRAWRFATSINLRDDLAEGSSYYLAEVIRIGELMEYAAGDQPYMLTIDEVFKGTNTIERIAAAKAVLSYLARQDALTLVSTHDLELADLLAGEYELYHFQESVTDQDLSFDYRIKAGVMTERNAVKLLRIAGYPQSVVEEARRVADQVGPAA